MPAHHVRFCKLQSCQPDGGAELARRLEERLGVKVDSGDFEDSISLESLDCIGLCDLRQAVLIDDEPYVGLPFVMRAVDELLEDSGPAADAPQAGASASGSASMTPAVTRSARQRSTTSLDR